MAFTGNEQQIITLEEGSEMTQRYRDSTPSQGRVLGHYMGRSALESILAQPGCVGIRIYYALDENDKKQLVLVGVNANENDLYQGIIADRSVLCPSNCSTNNPLNSD